MDIEKKLYGIVGRVRRVAVALACAVFLSAVPATAAALNSQFLATDVNAAQVMAGTPYDISDPAWLVGGKQNRSVFAYKIFAALLMLGYQTEAFQNGSDQVNAFKAFQTRNGWSATGIVDAAALTALDQQLVPRETLLATLAAQLPAGIYSHIQTPAPNDVSRDTIAALQSLMQSELPGSLQLPAAEMVQCIYGQCNGWIKDAGGVNDAPFPVDMNSDYRFLHSYFDPLVGNARLPGAAVAVETNLHEFAHYLDGFYYGLGGMYSGNFQTALQPHFGLIDTRGFYDINYDIATGSQGCFTKRSNDPKDWISMYGYVNYGDAFCAPKGKGWPFEEWAEAFQMYVTAGRSFRAAAVQSALIAQKYAWLKAHVFNGREYDTDLAQAANSGCNDVTGRGNVMRCIGSAEWDFSLPHGVVNGVCGSADGVISVAAPNANLCSAGSYSAVSNNGVWSWTCGGLNGGGSASCSAPILTGNPPDAPDIGTAIGGNTQASITFSAPLPGDAAIDGYTVVSNPAGGVDANAGTTALTHTLTGLTNGTAYTFTVKAHNIFGNGAASDPSGSVTPAWALVDENFDIVAPAALPPGWQSLIHLHADGIWRTNAGTHAPSGITAHSGSNLVYYNSNTALINGSAVLVSPPFSLVGISTAKVSFWMYRDDNSIFNNDRVNVYVSTTPTAGSIFGVTPLASIPRVKGSAPTAPAAGWYQYTAAIPSTFNGAVNYLIIDGWSAGGGNDMHLDDIVVAIPPGAPAITGVSGGNAQASVSFTPPLSNGGSAITSYTVTSIPAGGIDSNAGSATLTHTITGLTNGTAYTFTVSASNAIGSGAASAPSNSVIPVTVPGAPVIGSATAGNAQASVSFAPPASDGGSAITGYVVSSNPPGGVDIHASMPGLTHTVTGLSNGTQYTFTVTAINAEGVSQPSAASNAVTPATTPTDIALSASSGSSVYGEALTFTATVSGSGLSGTVSLHDNGAPIWIPLGLSGNQAQFSIDTLAAGSHSITATYSGDAGHAGSSSNPQMQVVSKAGTSISIASHTPNPSAYGAQIAVTVNLSVLAPGAGTPGGTITVSDGSAQCVANLPATSCYLTPSGSGAKSMTAAYGGNANFAFSTSAGVAHTVNPPIGGIILSSSRNPSTSGQSITFTASVSGSSPSGTVNFIDGASSIPGCAARPVSGGQATCATSALAAGNHNVTAYYSGDGINPAGNSGALAQKVLTKASAAVPVWLLLLLE